MHVAPRPRVLLTFLYPPTLPVIQCILDIMDDTPSKRRKLPSISSKQLQRRQSASYASSTRSSLARFNPNLLPSKRPNQVEGDELQKHSIISEGALFTKGLNSLPLRPTTPNRGGSGSPRRSVASRRASTASPTRQPLKGSGISGEAKRASQKSSADGDGFFPPTKTLPRSPILPARITIDVRSQEILQLPQHKYESREMESQEATAEDGQDRPNGEIRPRRATTRQSPPARESRTIYSPDGEPELPPTPVQLGKESTPDTPRGLLSSSPSGRASKRKAATKVKRGSPLKPQSGLMDLDSQRIPIEIQQVEPLQEVILDPETFERQKSLKKLHTRLLALREDVAILNREAARSRSSEILDLNEAERLL